jgi:hypothetical protein
MKVDKEFLKKHQFWLLLGFAVFLWLISLGVVLIGPRSKAAAAAKDYTNAQKKYVVPNDPKNKFFLTAWIERKDVYSKQKNEVWEEAWKTQDNLMTWPGNMLTATNTDLNAASFGDAVGPDSIQRYKADLYRSQFPQDPKNPDLSTFLAIGNNETVYFPIAWDKTVLGEHDWKDDPSTEECWLAQEELWLRREVFRILTTTLRSIGTFKEVREEVFPKVLGLAGGPALEALLKKEPQLYPVIYKERPTPKEQPSILKSRLFRNHSWEVELFLEKEPTSKDRLQISKLSTIKNINPYERSMALVNGGQGLQLRIRQGEQARNLTPLIGQLLPYGNSATLDKTAAFADLDLRNDFVLEEVFNSVTSPIKKIVHLDVGPNAQSSRVAAMYDLEANRMAPVEEKKENTGGATGGFGAMGGGPGAMGGGPGAMGGFPGGAMGGGPGAMGGSANQMGGNPGAAAKSEKTPNGFPRKRYTLVNESVRRIPIAFTVIIDQAQRSELLTAVTNSRLRLSTNQAHWRHCEPVPVAATTTPPATTTTPMGSGSGRGSDIGMAPMGTGGRPTEEKPGAMAEDNLNLIELSIYDVAILFERFKPPPKDASAGFPMDRRP